MPANPRLLSFSAAVAFVPLSSLSLPFSPMSGPSRYPLGTGNKSLLSSVLALPRPLSPAGSLEASREDFAQSVVFTLRSALSIVIFV